MKSKPTFYQVPPKEFFDDEKLISSQQLDEDRFLIDENENIYLEIERDWDDICVYLRKYTKPGKKNPNYEKELKQYNEALAKYKKDLAEWTALNKLIKEESERKLYLKLKAKYDRITS